MLNSSVYSQTNKEQDSLLTVINTSVEDTNKVNALVILGTDLVQYEINNARKYALQAVELSQKIK